MYIPVDALLYVFGRRCAPEGPGSGSRINAFLMNGIDCAMPSDSTKMLDDLCGEVLFSIGRVKYPRFLFPAKKAEDVRWDVVAHHLPKT